MKEIWDVLDYSAKNLFFYLILALVAIVPLWAMYRYPIKRIWFQKRIKKIVLSLKKNNSKVTLDKIEKKFINLFTLYENHYGFKFLDLKTQPELIIQKFKKYEIEEFTYWCELDWAIKLFAKGEMKLDELLLYLP